MSAAEVITMVEGLEPTFGNTVIRATGTARDLTHGDAGVGSWAELTAHTAVTRLQSPIWIRAQVTVGAAVAGLWHLRLRYTGPTGTYSLRHETIRLAPCGAALWGAVGLDSDAPLGDVGEVRHWQVDTYVPIAAGKELRIGPYWVEGAFLPDPTSEAEPEPGAVLARVRVPRLHLALAED